MKVPCGGFDLDESVFNVDKNSKQVKLNSPISYDYMPEGYPKKDGWSIEWDGNTEGKTSVVLPIGTLYKISVMVPSYDDLLGAMITSLDYPERVYVITSEDIIALSDSVIMISNPIEIIIASKDNADVQGFTIPEKGVYTNNDKFKMSKENITLMSTDFIPMVSETEPGLSIPLDNLYSNVLKQVHDQYFAGTHLQSTDYSDAEIINKFADKNNSYGIFQPGKFSGKVLSAYNDTTNEYLTVVLAGNNKVECRKASNGSTDIEQLWSIQKDGVIISSSTPDSTKKFKITVDDSGTIKATEVTG